MFQSTLDTKQMHGYAKLSAACDMARTLEFQYLWMDTCCIDKSSSSELSESINSMYRWYQCAALCIVYLDDVHRGDSGKRQADGEVTSTFAQPDPSRPDLESEFAHAKWFTRGWTLQELIAPAQVLFVDAAWTSFGTKHSLAREISAITGIDQLVLLTSDLKDISVAKKMSWAAHRETTRPEDRAYSLMGIFDVHMPTIYGEGDKAFIRLQEEIIKKSSDQSIFAWRGR